MGGQNQEGGPGCTACLAVRSKLAIGSQIRALAQPPVWRWVPDPEPQAPSTPRPRPLDHTPGPGPTFFYQALSTLPTQISLPDAPLA